MKKFLPFLMAFHTLFLNSCVSLAQDELPLIDFTLATERPDFNLVDMKNGQSYNSMQHDNAAFVLEFYFNGCPACNQNADNVKRLANEFKNNPNVQVLEISVDCDERQYRIWIEKHSPLGPVLNGCDAGIIDELQVSRFPTTYVFAPNKREAMRGQGVWSRSTYDRIKRYLDQVK